MLNAVGAQDADGKELRLVCVHWRSFPPPTAYDAENIEANRKAGLVSATDYQKHLVWARICGLTHMDRRKCRNCPHVRHLVQVEHLWVLRTVDGKISVPVVDLPTLESLLSRTGPKRSGVENAPRRNVQRTYIPGRKT